MENGCIIMHNSSIFIYIVINYLYCPGSGLPAMLYSPNVSEETDRT
jgi:hypothetical protein